MYDMPEIQYVDHTHIHALICAFPFFKSFRIKAKAAKRRQEEQQQHKQETQRQASRTADPEFGTFEKFTKGEKVGRVLACLL
jgi:hypothetical protein